MDDNKTQYNNHNINNKHIEDNNKNNKYKHNKHLTYNDNIIDQKPKFVDKESKYKLIFQKSMTGY